MIEQTLSQCGLVAILRGVTPTEVEAIGSVLYEAGLRIIEVPLNSPEPLQSINALRQRLPADCLIGAGTVLTPEQVTSVRAAGGELIVMPHSDPSVIRCAREAGLIAMPGVATPTEAFAALAAGADALKLFPAEQLGPAVLKAWRAVLPQKLALLPVGGITPASLATFVAAGANGFGLGSALYKPGQSAAEVALQARDFVAAWQRAQAGSQAAR
ncbi:2-dehydro-3-deoxy-6-phosphogalactonate aldolase [Paraburkholderia bonniea]|uniref:2-dehydro-3-deoxy-6-phosphogalactonate aldolase n=1 Tax=Paraburkholderia bonniea TaxID=2152891 RepID=UPI0025736AF1|nr:2-dehydro-3-deoxy-6-phosphogalactonate aldolase [Paraburkholderia bonniea]WJF89428.1 2-dehydro-3-deoxy-6-phosphogalactonate aldolase [Paraburkholderia bonniea]WJF92743.1 2-dehydro-3-deoxy-6-phosphogalactonate aldolase [Paraburkholderia bonniea]